MQTFYSLTTTPYFSPTPQLTGSSTSTHCFFDFIEISNLLAFLLSPFPFALSCLHFSPHLGSFEERLLGLCDMEEQWNDRG